MVVIVDNTIGNRINVQGESELTMGFALRWMLGSTYTFPEPSPGLNASGFPGSAETPPSGVSQLPEPE